MIKKTNKRSSTMTIIVLAMHLIVSAIKLVAAGGQELIVHRATVDYTPSNHSNSSNCLSSGEYNYKKGLDSLLYL